jgi:HEAT repeat protein
MKPKKTSATPKPITRKNDKGTLLSNPGLRPLTSEVAPTIAPAAPAAPVAPVAQQKLQVTPYIEQLRAGELASRMAAAGKLGELGGPEAITALQIALRDPTAEVAREATLALGKTRDTSVMAALAVVLENADGYFHSVVRTAAAESLSLFSDRQVIPTLKSAVRDPIAEASRAAIRGLGIVAGVEAVPTLLTVVSNPDNYFLPSVRATAIQVLAAIPGPDAANCLRQVRENPSEDPIVRQAALGRPLS